MAEDIKEKIIAWLADDEVDVKKVPTPPGAPIEWNLLATVRAPFPVKVNIQKKSGIPKLVLIVGIAFSPQHLELLKSLSEDERGKFISEMLRGILCLCPDCIVATQPPRPEAATSIIVTREVSLWSSSLREEISRSLRVLANAFVYTILTLTSRFGPPKRGGETGMTVV